jgi:hypothetical protein
MIFSAELQNSLPQTLTDDVIFAANGQDAIALRRLWM